jgi:uncharacterized protein (DUF4213/DUF364 family)
MITDRLLDEIQPGKTLSIQVGMSRTAVLAEPDDGIHCGLAATFSNPDDNHHINPSVAKAGLLLDLSTEELARLVKSSSLTEATIGLATINALLPANLNHTRALNGHDYLLEYGQGKNIAMIGHFPFIELLRPVTNNLWTLELNPKPGDIPANLAPEYLPKADNVAITATTIIDKTFDDLISFCRPGSTVIMLGPSTPLSPVLFDLGVNVISGTRVLDVQATMIGIAQASSIHQLKQRGFVEFITAEAGK